MPYVESLDELVEFLADLCGVYGVGPDGDHPDDCGCRICFTTEMKNRIVAAMKADGWVRYVPG